jgi:hypothetical protein
VQRRHQAVTAIVAGAGRHPHPAGVRCERERQARDGEAGAGHQRMRRQRGHRGLLDAPRRLGVEQGVWLSVGQDAMHGARR